MKYAEKLIKIAENEPTVYEAGRRAGVKKGKAELAESLNPTFDNIITTLDEMLTLQESLIQKLPTFTIEYAGTTYTFEFEEGMTWGDWINSQYNIEIDGDIIYANEAGYVMCLASYVRDSSNNYEVLDWEQITKDGNYAIW